jgi:dephospho-CoA kinase
MALKVGLTGGVACGKTTVSEMFAHHGAHVIQADKIAHLLMQKDSPAYVQIVNAFGSGILNEDGTISRPKLADAAFGSGRIPELNAIVHPAVIAAVEAALILEAHAEDRFDKLMAVTCTLDQKIERFAARHNQSITAARIEVERRMKAQLSDEEKVRAADYVIDNSGSLSQTTQQVGAIWGELSGLAAVR